MPAGGVVVDVGALNSHSVIVSRELGIPCVVSVMDATKRIPDGAMIEVDGSDRTGHHPVTADRDPDLRSPVHLFGRAIEYKWIVVGVVVSSLFLDILDVTIVNVALPAMGQQLHSDAVEWVVLAYTLALAVCIPAAGWWSDRIGTKRAFLVSLTLFIGFSVMSGMAQSMGQLILFRIFQGIGGGMLTPIAMAMLFRAFLPSERARASTAVMIPTMLAPALGPIIGGILVTQVGWRWIFWVNFPVGLVAFVFGWKYLREHKEPTAGRFDLPGFLLSRDRPVVLDLRAERGAARRLELRRRWCRAR